MITSLRSVTTVTGLVLLLIAVLVIAHIIDRDRPAVAPRHTASTSTSTEIQHARQLLAKIPVKGRAPKTGYARNEFSGGGWGAVGGCDVRNVVLARDLSNVKFREGTRRCVVDSGTLTDPYTGDKVDFVRGNATSARVQIDHRVPLLLAWQQGAQRWSPETRVRFYNDLTNLVAVEGSVNQAKGASGPGSWLPPAKRSRCSYVASFVQVTADYRLSLNPGDHEAAAKVLSRC